MSRASMSFQSKLDLIRAGASTKMDLGTKENKGIICPMPRLWNAIYQISKKEYIKKYQIWDKEEEFHQCVPLILAGWWASDDLQKKIPREEITNIFIKIRINI